MRSLKEIIVHCSATPEGRDVSVKTIDSWHKGRGWSGIGYHFVIYLDGSIHKGRPVSRVGAHVAGRNKGTIGICYIGGVEKDGKTPKDTRTAAQKAALLSLLKELVAKYPTIKLISGHHDYSAKACPCFPARKEYAHLTGGSPKSVPAPKVDERYRWLQRLLTAAGHPHGLADGIEGPETRKAIKAYQAQHGLEQTGKFDTPTVAALRHVEESLTPKPIPKLPQKPPERVPERKAPAPTPNKPPSKGRIGAVAVLFAILILVLLVGAILQ